MRPKLKREVLEAELDRLSHEVDQLQDELSRERARARRLDSVIRDQSATLKRIQRLAEAYLP